MPFSYSNVDPETAETLRIIPEEVQNELIQIGANWRRDKFRIAELTIQMVKAVKDGRFYLFQNVLPGTRPGASVMSIYDAVSVLLGREVSPRTIRYWVQVISAFTPEQVEKYHILPFDHFAVASHAEDPAATLDLALAQTVVNNGIIPTSDWLATQTMAGGSIPPEPEYMSMELQVERIMDKIEDATPAAKDEVKSEILELTDAFGRVMRVSGRALDLIRKTESAPPDVQAAKTLVSLLDKIIEIFEFVFPGIAGGLK